MVSLVSGPDRPSVQPETGRAGFVLRIAPLTQCGQIEVADRPHLGSCEQRKLDLTRALLDHSAVRFRYQVRWRDVVEMDDRVAFAGDYRKCVEQLIANAPMEDDEVRLFDIPGAEPMTTNHPQ